MSDLELIEAYRKGNDKAFTELHNRYRNIIISVIREFIRDNQTINDYSQDIWLLIVTKLDKFKDGSFVSWLYTIAKNYCIDKHRRMESSRQVREYSVDDFSYLDCQDETDGRYTSYNLDVMSDGFKDLIESQQKILVLRMQGLSMDEIANKLNLPFGTVTCSMRYITINLRKHFYKLGYHLSNTLDLKLHHKNNKRGRKATKS